MITTLQSESLTVKINSKGAEICSVKNQDGLEFLWQASAEVWPRHAPVLFPVVGKLKNNSFEFNNSSYELGQHGFARDLEFEILSHLSVKRSCAFELRANDKTRSVFPFDFIFRINYYLSSNTLFTRYDVINPSNSPLYFSLGAHPGFNCPLEENECLSDYFLEFEASEYSVSQLSNGMRSGEKKELKLTDNKLKLSPDLFNNDALVFENKQINSIQLCSSVSKHRIKLNCKNWPYFGIWSKNSRSPFVCLEPWYGIADKVGSTGLLEEKDGIIKLEPKSDFTCEFSMEFL